HRLAGSESRHGIRSVTCMPQNPQDLTTHPEHSTTGSPGDGRAPAVRLENVTKVYGTGSQQVAALMGPSGSGKSTFLNSAAGLDKPTSGRVILGTTEVSKLKARKLTTFRRDHVGFIFQAYNLLPHLSVAQNITLPLLLARHRVDQAWFNHIVQAVGLANLVNRSPQELSGGQQQRAAI